jgi:hypothetical protein
MPHSKPSWTEDDIAKLKSMAGKVPWEGIAAEPGRSRGALAVKACELGLSLRTKPRAGKGKRARMVALQMNYERKKKIISVLRQQFGLLTR